MKTLAFDISSKNTGWTFLDVEDGELINHEYSSIIPCMTMNNCQKIYFFGNEINKII